MVMTYLHSTGIWKLKPWHPITLFDAGTSFQRWESALRSSFKRFKAYKNYSLLSCAPELTTKERGVERSHYSYIQSAKSANDQVSASIPRASFLPNRVGYQTETMWEPEAVYLISAVFALAMYWWWWSRRKILAAVANMNGPPALPLIGHLYIMVKFTTTEAIYHNLKTFGDKYPSPLCIHLGTLVHVFLYSPEELQIMLNSPFCLSKSIHYKFLRVDGGIFAAPGHIWKGQRKLLNLSLGPAILNSSVAMFNEKSDILIKRLEEYADGIERDYYHDIAKCTLDVIYYAALGLDFDLQRTRTGDYYLSMQDEFIDIVAKRIFSPSLYPEFTYRMTKSYKREQQLLNEARVLTKRIMQERKVNERLSSKKGSKESTRTEIDGKIPLNFLDALLELARDNKHLTQEAIIQHLDTIIFAGSDTTATTMSSLLLMLAIHPDVQERVYQEVMEACPDKDQSVSLEDLSKLTYTEMVCKETMRLFPVAPIVARISTQDIKLNDRNTIPAKSVIVGAIYQVQRDPKIWGPDAHLFNPDHFLPENASQRHPYAYIPFSGGIRNCLGIRYAWVLMKIMIVHLIRKYQFKTSLRMDSINIKYSIILKITNGCLVSLEKQAHHSFSEYYLLSSVHHRSNMFGLLFTLFLITTLSYYYHFRRSRKRLYELAAKLPGPLDLPLIGITHLAFRGSPTETFDHLLQYLHKLPSPMRAWCGPLLFVVVDQPEHLAIVLNSQDCIKRASVYQFIGLEKGVFNAAPDLWRKLRKQLNPSFAVPALKSFAPTFNEKADLLVKNLECMVGEKPFDLLYQASEYMLATSAINSLGLDMDDDINYKQRYLKNTERLFTLVMNRIFKAWLYPECIYRLTSSYREEMNRRDMLQEVSKKVFAMRKEAKRKESRSATSTDRDENNFRRPQIFIDKLECIADEMGILDEDGVIQNLVTFIFASNDTTSSAMATTVLMLAMHPKVQERVFQEVISNVPGSYIDYDDLPKLAYLEMVIKEAIRLFPIVPAIGRLCEKELQIGEFIIPANAQIVIPVIKINRNKNVWGEMSDQFDPENFSEEKCAKRHPHAYLSFSGGIRNCIGIKYAMIAMKIGLVKLIKSYVFSTDLSLADVKFHFSIVRRISNGLVKLEKREKQASLS
ncbi:uncharacterized protein LOC131680752 [Topomyia yanbarensis]|uniref:uncharacterized protein LOC131680752 n=1 Tax=Topomyia yanbarensis TaxID=2498891 RepID=UPI00273A94A4|nr:uncharacterized protein LOC131680752 [Topomyia yanbarensis]